MLKIFPKKIRDLVYDYIAKNRYKWFGKTENCMMPTPEIQSKFLL
jgi:predicted DCC family thiol-disulfide oxidoreductase YuxK